LIITAISVVLIGASAHAAHAQPRPALRVAIINQAGLPAAAIEAAQHRVVAIYDAVGVAVAWAAPEATQAKLMVIIRRAPLRQIEDNKLLGIAPTANTGKGRQAMVFYREIERTAHSKAVHTNELLGYVIAHELGHLLLPPSAHSANGIMRAHWGDRDYVRIAGSSLTFTDDQVEAIRTKLANNTLQE
jgi:hypothetical protein